MVTIKLDEKTLHAPALDDKTRILHKPHLRIELNRPDVLTFTVPPDHALFGQIQKRKGTVTVEIDGAEYFRGQVIDERPNINNMIEYTCEGMLSYLMDSIQRPYKIEEGAEIPVTELFGRLIENHNAQVETEKQFTVGTVNATDKLIHTDSTDFATTLHEINLLCIGRYGGFLRVRRENGINYIDWLKELTDVCTQAVEFGENIIDIDGLIDTREVGSVLIPLGAQTKGKKLTIDDVNGGSDYLESPELIQKYGRVVVTRDFPTIKDANELLNKGREALLEMEDDESFDITAVDLSCLGINVSALRVGLLTPIRAPRHGIDKSKILYAADMDLENIENSVYTFGVPRQTLTEALAETARGGGAAGKKIEELKDIITDAYIDIDRLNGEILLRAYQDEMDTRFSEAWIDINGAKADLMLKADQETVDELSRTVTKALIDIDGVEADILLKADKTYVEDLEKTVNQAQIDIDGANAKIEMKADTETVNALGERVSSAEIKIDGLEGQVEILVNKQVSLDQYEDRLVSVESSVTTNAESISLLSETVDDTGERLSGAELRLDGVEGSVEILARKQVSLDQYEGRLSECESSIGVNTENIKLNSRTINNVNGRVTSANLRIDGVEGVIETLTEKQEEIDGELTNMQSSITQNAQAITAKVSKTDFNSLGQRVTNAESTIEANAGSIELNSQSINKLSGDITSANLRIDGVEGSITTLTKKQTEIDGELSDLESSIEQNAGSIELNSQSINKLSGDMTSANLRIDGVEGSITTLTQKQTEIDGDIFSLESSIDQHAGSIEFISKSMNKLNGDIAIAELRIDGVEGSITTLTTKQEEIDGELLDLESSITQTAGSIELHSQSINKLTGDMSSATVRIDGVESIIDLKADKTYVDNLFAESITAENLSSSLSNLTAIINDSIQGNTGDFETVIAQGVQIGASGGLSVGGLNYSAHCHEIHVSNDGTVTFGAVTGTPQNFKIADTKAYKDGVSAAKASVTADVMGKWEPGGYKLITLSNDKTYGIWLPTFSASGGETFNDEFKTNVYFYANEVTTQPLKTVEVDASGVYEDGYKAGWAAAKAMIRHDQDDKRLFFGPSSVVDEEEQIFRVTVAAELTGPINSAKGVVSASAAARVYLDGTQILYANQHGTLNINAGML